MDRTDEEWNPGTGPHGGPRRHFRIVKLLGIGGFGSVYEALLERQDGFRKTVALKILHDEDVPPYVLKRFRDEAKVLGLLRDRAIVGVDVPTKLMDRWSIIMECVDGATASQVLKFVGPIPPRVALSIVSEIARALHKVYQLPGEDGQPIQLIHRDIKAANVSITREGDVKILDFGIARANFTARESSTLQNAGPDGTVGYIAPERFEGLEGPEGDIYSLGVTLYVMLTRVRPTHIDRRVDHPEAAMRQALEVAVSMCELDSERRPSAAEVHRMCRSLVTRMPGPSLAEWAERVVPDAQEAAQRHLSMSEEGDKLGLVGTILTEEPSSRPIMTAAPVTPTPTSAERKQSPPPPPPVSEGLRVRTAKVRVSTGEVARPFDVPPRSRPITVTPGAETTHPAGVATQTPNSLPDRRGPPSQPIRTRTPVSAAPRSRTPVATGALPPRTGALPARTGALPPRTGSVARTGSLPPRTGSVARNGSLPPRTGSVARTGSLPPRTGALPPRTGALPPRTGSVARSRTPVSTGARQHTPRSPSLPPRERTDPLAARSEVFREFTSPRPEGTNPRLDAMPSLAEGSSPRLEYPLDDDTGWAHHEETAVLDPLAPLDGRPAQPSRFLAAGFAGLLTAVGILAVLAVGVLWVAENQPQLFDQVGIDPESLQIPSLDVPAWMLPGKDGLRPEPGSGVEPERDEAIQGSVVPTRSRPRRGPDASTAGDEAPAADVNELLPANGTAGADLGKTKVRFVFRPGGVEMKVDDVIVVRDSPTLTTLDIDNGAREFEFLMPDGATLDELIVVGGTLGATLIEIRDGRLSHCRPTTDVQRCRQ